MTTATVTRTQTLLGGDLFCGAGGSSTGAIKAVKELGYKLTLTCVNHWPIAIETHRKNHPEARHYVVDINLADPVKIVPEGYLDFLMASPECTGFSRARGGKPTNDQQRMPPFRILDWLTKLDVRILIVENVPEFIQWGPLGEDGKANPKSKGMYFQSWYNSIRELGYDAQWRYLNAADFGDVTTRTRFFLIARKDGKAIRWPKPSNSATGNADMIEHLPKWRAAREIINWTHPGRSLLDDPRYLKKPLSDKTLTRIAKGLEKFGGALAPLYIQLLGLKTETTPVGVAAPFIMGKQSSPAYRSTDEPIPTLTTEGAQALIEPVAKPFLVNNRLGANDDLNSYPRVRDIEKPVQTITGHGAGSLVEPLMIKYYSGDDVSSIDAPVPTVTTKDRFRLVQPFILEINHSGGDRRPVDTSEPLKTLTSKKGSAIVTPFMVQWDQTGSNGACVRPVDSPLATVVTKKNTGLVEPILETVKSSQIDPRRLVLINGEPYLLDIRFRMLENLELARAMGFTDGESTYEFCGNKSEVTKQIGNAVPVNLAKALVKAVLG